MDTQNPSTKLPFRLEAVLPFAIFGLFFFCCIITTLSDMLFYFDFYPASGTATGYISYQEKGGFYKLDSVCWRDTPYSYCETFDPGGKRFAPGKYNIEYECSQFVWAWEKSSLCTITSATKIGEVESTPRNF
jgi:hypothetical protein